MSLFREKNNPKNNCLIIAKSFENHNFSYFKDFKTNDCSAGSVKKKSTKIIPKQKISTF